MSGTSQCFPIPSNSLIMFVLKSGNIKKNAAPGLLDFRDLSSKLLTGLQRLLNRVRGFEIVELNVVGSEANNLHRVYAFIRIAPPDDAFESGATHGDIAELFCDGFEDVFLLIPDR